MVSREASFSRSSKFLIVQTSPWDSKQLDVYDLSIAKHQYTIKNIHIENARCFAIDPKERTLLVRQEGSLRELHHLQTGQPIASKELIQYFDADYSDSGAFVVATPRNPYSEQTLVELYDPQTLERTQSYQCDYPAVFAEVTPDGKRTIVGHLYGNGAHLLSCWNVETGKQLWSRAGSAGRHSVFSPPGSTFYLGTRRFGRCGRSSLAKFSASSLWMKETNVYLRRARSFLRRRMPCSLARWMDLNYGANDDK